MEKITKDHPLSGSQDILADNIQKLKEIFPEVFSEGRVDFEKLQLLLGDLITPKDDLYGLNWWGKSEAIKESMKRSLGTLRFDRESSKNPETTENLYIEGDNLEVLKLLQKSYNNKIKMIYIDPPYNTGKDFVYKDNYKDNLKNYLEQTGQVDSEGVKQSTNTKEDGRYHSNWLNMMYPRLKLARNLLTEDGVIFISIDDNEVHSLKNLSNEIFGEGNFIAEIVWERSYAPINMVKHFSKSHDYVLCYAKNVEHLNCFGLVRPDATNAKYGNPDNDPRGLWRTDNLSVGPVVEDKVYEITTPSGRKCLPPKGRCWLYTKERYEEMVADNRIWFGIDGNNVPAPKRFLEEVKQGLTPMTIWKYTDVGHNQDSMRELRQLFDGEKIFDYSKPVRLIKQMLQLYTTNNDLILDFFAGSATTAHAVIDRNMEDGGNRKYICVQIPEPTDEKSEAFKAGYKNIAEIGKERIRRAGDKILIEKKEELEQLKSKTSLIQTDEEKAKIQELEDIISKLDIGFKVFKLDSSNIEAWDTEMPETVQGIQTRLEESRNHLKKGRTEEDLLYELLLKQGLLLTSPIEERSIAGAKVYSISHGELFICMNAPITMQVIEGIGTWGKSIIEEMRSMIPDFKIESTLVLKDEAFGTDDAFKSNAVLRLKNEFGFAKVNSI